MTNEPRIDFNRRVGQFCSAGDIGRDARTRHAGLQNVRAELAVNFRVIERTATIHRIGPRVPPWTRVGLIVSAAFTTRAPDHADAP